MSPSVSIFVKTHPPDYPWLEWCLRSVEKFAVGFIGGVTLQYPGQGPRPALSLRLQVRYRADDRERGDRYLYQQVAKVYADEQCSGDFITYLDSDCVLAREFRPEELFREGKPMLLTRRWEGIGDAACWKDPAERVLGQEATHETMACHPMIYRRETLKAFRDFVRFRHGVEAADYILSQRSFSEFNALGNFVLQHERELYTIVECGPEDGYPRPVRQFWSHSGITPEIRAELERLVP